jgi:Uma2 family endonuclease
MATAEPPADLLERLGDIPISRIRLVPPPGTATEQDVIDLHDHTDRLYELVHGVLIEKAMGFRESILAAFLIQVLKNFVDQHSRGVVAGADGMMRLAAGLVRIPDVSFVAWDRLPNRRIPDEPIPDLAANLAVEVLSAGNTHKEMQRKLHDYFAAGVELAWLVDPRSRTVAVYTSAQDFTVLHEGQMLDGGTVLPGFSLPLRDLFAQLEAHG